MISRQKGRVGIRWRLFGCLALLTALTLAVLWLFQVRLLSTFYEREKFSDLKENAATLEDYICKGRDADLIKSYARENAFCVRVFRMSGNGAWPVADADVASNCMIHHFSSEVITFLYETARDNGGQYDERLEFTAEDVEADGRFPGFPHRASSANAIHARVFETGGMIYLMLLDCELTPVDAIVRTLQTQFIWIAGVLLGIAFLFALLLSRIVAKPLILITQKAERLSAGEFEADFKGEGYREVEELADALSFAAKEIGATERLQRELIANISHDLRTPLTMIKGYSEMMRDIPGENSPENIQAVIDEATRLSELVSDLMDLSKLQSGTLKPEFSNFDLTQVLRDALARYDALIRHKGYHIETVIDVESVFVQADRTMILQVIYNLVGNAVNYTGADKRVLVSETVKDGVVRISVADNGEGIPPERMKEIWDRYYRVDREHRRAVMGTGLGLSIVKNVMEAHRASYGVESAVGAGSVFWFELPILSNE